ncbi:acyl-CoA dehydrogenase family protein (plasmid) [Methylobacterium currus]|uniref:acyl-CoA dehydrogenase family protein n=1 Tax=Methylobacterium currus TaxID=2051553 RepID=UPI001E394510|nr:acyl-CoA dehydrogenase family protein [Methylobacterium currus]UHC20211.1 acyl-CoA dehydrogenase family protein [Methylobacterium currus]
MTMAAQVAGAIPDARGLNLYRADRDAAALFGFYLPDDLFRHLGPHLDRLGALAGGPLDELAATADRNPPILHLRRRTGEDCAVIEKHPAYVEMERLAYSEFGLAALSHRGGVLGWPEPMPPAAKYALTYLFVQAEFGLCCPVSMTDSLTRTLKRYGSPDLVERYLARLTSLDFDAMAQGAMFMTEQGAGSDVAATATRAEEQADGTWRLTGDKWFCSNADADLAMVLARSEGVAGLRGVSLFLLPKLRRDGLPNDFRILRLKDKLGTRSMASGEIRLEGAEAYLVGARGRGFHQMADMINNSRLSNGMRAAGLMRRATTEALFIASRRQAFGRPLIALPLMRRQLAKMLVWTEQARTMLFVTADALHRANGGDPEAARLARILTPLIKFRACRDARRVTGDAMEVRGGCGYIEEWSDPRLLRDAHLGSIWEGTSNIVALDVLRAITRDDALPALRAHLASLLDAAGLAPLERERFAAMVERACAFAESAAREGADTFARQAASGLYHAVTAAGLAREAAGAALPHRLALARLVLAHRLSPRDPLGSPDDTGLIDAVLDAAVTPA